MRKDPKISEYLDAYASGKPDKSVLYAASAELKAGAEKKKRARVRLTACLSAAAALCVVIAVVLATFSDPGRKDTAAPVYFSASAVSGRAMSRAETDALLGDVFGSPAEEEYALFTFREDGENAFVRARLRVERAGGVDNVTVYVMLTEKTYRPLQRFESMADGESSTRYEDGEYRSDVRRDAAGKRFFLLIESPNPGMEGYID